jgi:hypothetical protein
VGNEPGGGAGGNTVAGVILGANGVVRITFLP